MMPRLRLDNAQRTFAALHQPLDRFLLASVGSTRVLEGIYAHDLDSFIIAWQRETRQLENHRTARAKHD